MNSAGTSLIAGIDLGGTKIAVTLAGPEGIIARRRQPVPLAGSPEAIAQSMRALLEQCCADGRVAWDAINEIGLASCGPFGRDPAGRLTLLAPNLCGGLSEDSGLPNRWRSVALEADCQAWQRPVTIVNDAAAALVAEHRFGRLTGYRDAAYLTWSTGIGVALMSDGRLLRGKHGNAGHAGHAIPVRAQGGGVRCGCGNIDDIEALAGGASLARAWGATTESLFDAYRQGDPKAQGLVDRALDAVSASIYNLTVTLDLECVVLGGGLFWAQRDLLLDRLRQRVFAHPARSGLAVMFEGVRIESVADPERTADLGALCIVMPPDWATSRFSH